MILHIRRYSVKNKMHITIKPHFSTLLDFNNRITIKSKTCMMKKKLHIQNLLRTQIICNLYVMAEIAYDCKNSICL